MTKDNPQFPQTKRGVPREEELCRLDDNYALRRPQTPSWAELQGEIRFEIGVVVSSADTVNYKLAETTKPISSCTLSSVVILNQPSTSSDQESTAQSWIRRNRLQGTTIKNARKKLSVGWGQLGFDALLETNIDAVFIIVPPG